MTNFIRKACGTQFAESQSPPPHFQSAATIASSLAGMVRNGYRPPPWALSHHLVLREESENWGRRAASAH